MRSKYRNLKFIIYLVLAIALATASIQCFNHEVLATDTGLSDKILGLSSAGYDPELDSHFSVITIYDSISHPPPRTEATGYYTLDRINIPDQWDVNGRAIAFDGQNIWFSVLDQRGGNTYSTGKIYKIPFISGSRPGEGVELGQLESVADPFGPGFGFDFPSQSSFGTNGIGAMDFYKGNLWVVSYIPDAYGRNLVAKYDTNTRSILASCYLQVTDPTKGGTDSFAIFGDRILTSQEDIGTDIYEYYLPTSAEGGLCTPTGNSVTFNFRHTGIDIDSSNRLLVGTFDTLLKPPYGLFDSYHIFVIPNLCRLTECEIGIEDIATTRVESPTPEITFDSFLRDESTGEGVSNAIVPYGTNLRAGVSLNVDWDAVSSGTSYPPPAADGTITYELFYSNNCDGQRIAIQTVNVINSQAEMSAINSMVQSRFASYKITYNGNYGNHSDCLFVDVIRPEISTTIRDRFNIDITGRTLPLGSQIHDTVRISGGIGSPGDLVPQGLVTYQRYFSTSSNPHQWCTGPHEDETVTIQPDGTIPPSRTFTVDMPGTVSYRVVADQWPADFNLCESVHAGPSISTEILDMNGNVVTNKRVLTGTEVYDTVSLTETGGTPTGEVTYQRFSTGDCTGNHEDETVTIQPDGTIPPSRTFTIDTPGPASYRATFSNVIGECEPITFSSIETKIIIESGQDVTGKLILFGNRVRDTSVVNPGTGIATGLVIYQLFDTIDCTGNHIDKGVPVNLDGSVPPSDWFEPHFPANVANKSISYSALWRHSGDIVSSCEPLTYTPVSLALLDENGQDISGSSIPSGTKIHAETRIIAGAVSPGNVVTYHRFMNDDCRGDFDSETVDVGRNGVADPSSPFTLASSGQLSYKAYYTNLVSSPCVDVSFAP